MDVLFDLKVIRSKEYYIKTFVDPIEKLFLIKIDAYIL